MFSDEAGVPAMSPTEPYFGIGVLKIADAGRWNDDLNHLLDQFVAGMSRHGRSKPRSHYEFKFKAITGSTRPHYDAMVDYFLRQTDGCFTALIVDKTVPGTNPIKACGSAYEAIIAYTSTVLKNRLDETERAILIADNYQRPRALPKYFEREIIRALGTRVANVTMTESHGSNMLQLVDVLLGAVMYHFKRSTLARVDTEKIAVADRIAAAYGVRDLAHTFKATAPNRFDVWRFQPRAPV